MAGKSAPPAPAPAPAADPTPAPAPAADPTPAPAPAADPTPAPAEQTFTKADLDRELDKQKKAFEAEQKKEKERAELTDAEKKDAEIIDLKNTIRLRDAKDEVVAALTKEGAKGTDLMWKAIKGEIEFDEKTGKATNLKELIKDLKADYPDSFGEPKPTEGIDGGKGQDQNTGTLTKEKLAAMSPKEIQALDWEEVKKVMAAK